MVKYLKNRGNLYYKIVRYDKGSDTIRLVDPHTEEEFEVLNVTEAIKLGEFKIIRRAE